ncbi:amidase domain-containing protein [Paenibacillus sp. FSL H8-0259]|uniref:amidase domain-containing protein n=1 Tax=Paenibacillus sp. FSL H8-0259 TaxID=1920423 RepID=UPI00096CBA3C|nr:amidase domain-containing protein [Paenibacillus sp. FSL H8-0259]OMF31325.1 hypothetical protein BK132_07980 [Paenibacillus sp. FSL H8-0259]
MNPNAATPNSASLASVSSTARSNIVTYAIVNSSKTDPSSGNSSYAPYYDFSAIANDCTNFISHSLLAGGAKENRTSWYYDSLSARTPSWAGVNEFHDPNPNRWSTPARLNMLTGRMGILFRLSILFTDTQGLVILPSLLVPMLLAITLNIH